METDFTFEIWAGFISSLIILGILGNALTIIAVAHAKLNGKHNFADIINWNSKTVFVLNLAFVDLSYCLFMLSKGTFSLLVYLKFYVGDTSGICKVFVLGIQNLAVLDGWSIALIAITRAFPKIK